MEIAGTIAIIFIIIWAYKILFGSLEQDKTKWKDTIIMALSWFAIASLAWFIIKLIIDNFS
jgi:type IV secretory pathway VirB2 component (pilin)